MLLTYNPPRRRYRISRIPRPAVVHWVTGVARLAAVRGVTGIPRSAAVRWLAGLIGVSAMALLPWTVYLASSLPPSISARHSNPRTGY